MARRIAQAKAADKDVEMNGVWTNTQKCHIFVCGGWRTRTKYGNTCATIFIYTYNIYNNDDNFH